jgi:hypothetical protein
VQYSQGLNLNLEERVRRKFILAGILPKLFDLGHGAIGEAIEAAGAEQFGRLHEALKLHRLHRYNNTQNVSKSLIAWVELFPGLGGGLVSAWKVVPPFLYTHGIP